jgi:hypothetical protein
LLLLLLELLLLALVLPALLFELDALRFVVPLDLVGMALSLPTAQTIQPPRSSSVGDPTKVDVLLLFSSNK